MERLRQYCVDIIDIDSLRTFIISPSKYEDILKDSELLKDLEVSEKWIASFIRTLRELNTDKIYFAFVYHLSFIKKFQWMPVFCYKSGKRFYHVHYRASWMCRECGNILNEPVIMPLVEAEPYIYPHSEQRDISLDIPLLFKKIKCPVCGKALQNHFIMIK